MFNYEEYINKFSKEIEKEIKLLSKVHVLSDKSKLSTLLNTYVRDKYLIEEEEPFDIVVSGNEEDKTVSVILVPKTPRAKEVIVEINNRIEEIEKLDNLLKYLNEVIETSIYHGGDVGGPYYTNKEELNDSIQKLIDFLNLNCQVVWEDDIPKIVRLY